MGDRFIVYGLLYTPFPQPPNSKQSTIMGSTATYVHTHIHMVSESDVLDSSLLDKKCKRQLPS